MDFNSVIRKRKSTRFFLNKKVSWKAAMDAIEVANQGPFAGNHNNLKFVIVENKQTIKKLADLSDQDWISHSTLLIIVCSDDTHLENLYGERGRVYSRQQAGAAINNVMLKLADLDLASSWIGSYTDEIVKQTLKIPQNIQIEAIIPVGYENRTKPAKKPKKQSLESTVFWERWENSKKPNFLTENVDLPKDPEY